MCEPQGQLVSPEPTGIALSPDGGTAYIVQVAGSITVRNILPNGTFQSSNRNSTGSNLVGPLGITISPDGTKAYVVNFGAKPGSISNVTVCNIDVGSDLSCSEPSGTNFNGSVGIALNPIGSIAYVTNNADNSITACRTFGDRLTDCQVSAQKNLDQPAGIAISPDGLTAYVTNNGNNTLSICRVLDYTLQCGRGLDLHGLLKDPGLVTLSRDGSQLFIANSGANNVVVCSVSGQEVQEPCHATGSNFATPFDVAVY